MKKLLLLFLALIPIISFSQEIEIDSLGTFYYNQKVVEKSMNEEDMLNIFGKPNRVSNKAANIIWTYDSLGYFIYIHPDTRKINAISINFKIDKVHHYPTKNFNGKIMFNHSEIKKSTSLSELKKIKTKKREYGFPVYSVYFGTISINIFQNYNDPTYLTGCEISF